MRILSRLFGPRHCETCGDEFVTVTYRDGFDRGSGKERLRSFSKCPRSSDRRPEYYMRGQMGRCIPPPPFACANQVRGYTEHRPYWTACPHASVSEMGDRCWSKDGTLITGVAA